jgi:hypothetical protein
MEEHLIENLKNRGISNNSIKLYLFQLRQLNGGELENVDFLRDISGILNKLKKYKPSTIRTKLIAVIACLKCVDEPELLKEYMDIVKNINDNTDNTTKSESQEKNWMSKEDIMELWKNYSIKVSEFSTKRKIDEKQYDILLQYMILSLYVLITPRRNADYGLMKVVKKTIPDMSEDFNYLDLKTRRFIFNNYKTKNKYNQQVENIPDELWSVIKIYLKFHPKDCEFFLCTFDGKPLPHINSITLILNKIFGKRVGCSLLRSIFATDSLKEIQPLLDQVKQIAKKMGNSSTALINNYIKKG